MSDGVPHPTAVAKAEASTINRKLGDLLRVTIPCVIRVYERRNQTRWANCEETCEPVEDQGQRRCHSPQNLVHFHACQQFFEQSFGLLHQRATETAPVTIAMCIAHLEKLLCFVRQLIANTNLDQP